MSVGHCSEPPFPLPFLTHWDALGESGTGPLCGLPWPEDCDVYMQREDW